MLNAHNPTHWKFLFQAMAKTRRQYGTPAMFYDVADRLGRRLIGLVASHIFCYELDPGAETPPSDKEFSFRFLTSEDIRSFAADPVNELDDCMADRVATGRDLCFGVLSADRLAGYGWCALHSVEGAHTGGVSISFPPRMGYMYKGFTHPDYRGRRLNGLRMALAARALAEQGVHQLIALVDWTNWNSLRSCRRSSCRELGMLVGLTWAGKQRWWIPEAARQLGIRFGEEAGVPLGDWLRTTKPTSIALEASLQ